MYEAMVQRVAERCLTDLRSDSPLAIAKGLANSMEVLTTVQKELNLPEDWATNNAVYRAYLNVLQTFETSLDSIDEQEDFNLIRDVAEGRKHLY